MSDCLDKVCLNGTMAIHAHGIGPRHMPQRGARIWRRWWFWVIIAVFVIAVAAIAWIGSRALAAKAELEAAQVQVGKLKIEASAQKFTKLSATLVTLKGHSRAAVKLTSDPIWRLAEGVPVLGNNLTVVRKLAAVTNDVVIGTVAPLVDVASGLTPASFAPVNGALNLAPLVKAVPAVAAATKSLDSVSTQIAAIDVDGTIRQVSAAKAKLSRLVSSVSPLLDSANTYLPLLPVFLGADSPRNYVIAFQNNAESRALGGTALSFATLTIDKGKIALVSSVSAGFDHFKHYSDPVIPIPDGVEALFGGALGRFIPNATVRPDFVTAAQIINENWKRQFGTPVDGVISIDPVALSYVLRATTPITLTSGDILTPTSLVPLLINGVYQRYNTGNDVKDNRSQDVVYGEAVAATFAKLSGGPLDPKLLIAALLQGASEGRLNYWSTKPAEEAVVAKAKVFRSLPVSDSSTERIGVYFQDNIGSKLNFYLNQKVHTGQAVCRADGRETYRVGVDLMSTVPANTKLLSPSILGNWKAEKVKQGVQRMFVYVYAPPGSQIAGATVNGAAVALDAQHDETYPVARLRVSVNPGATVSMTVDITAAKVAKKTLEAQVTPMVNATAMMPTPLDCATVSSK